MNTILTNTVIDFFGRHVGMHPVPGDIGIELEIEGEKLPQNVAAWSCKPEGSLRGGGDPSRATEYITRGAVKAHDIQKVIAHLLKAFEANNAVVKPSHRCSTHIHVNMQKETFRTVLGYCLIFAVIEPLLLRLCGPDRNGNVFCLSSYEAGDAWYWSSQVAKHLNARSFDWQLRGKYSSLNTDCLRSFGSLEIRCFPLSVDPKELMKWCTWAMNIRTIAREWKDMTYRSLFEDVRNNPIGFAERVLTNVGNLQAVTAPYNPVTYIQAGLETSYELYRGFKPVFADKPTKQPSPRKKPNLTLSPVEMATLQGWVGNANLATFNVGPAVTAPEASGD